MTELSKLKQAVEPDLKLEGAAERFHLLSYGLASVLLFIGAKMLIAGVWTIPIGVALGVVALLIGASMVASLVIRPKQPANVS